MPLIKTAEIGKDCAGIWVTQPNEDDFITMRHDLNGGPGGHLDIRKPGHALPLAITHEGIQLPQKKGEPYRFIKWDELWSLVHVNDEALAT